MFEPGEFEHETVGETAPSTSISRELFLQWREVRRGNKPAENMTNPVWQWLIDSNVPASFASQDFGCEDLVWGTSQSEGTNGKYSPGWCYNRFGRTLTILPDGGKSSSLANMKMAMIPTSQFTTMLSS